MIRIMKSLFEIVSLNAKERVKSRTEMQKERFDEGILQLEQMFTKQDTRS